MNKTKIFENTGIRINDGEVYATRKQVQELYESPRKTVEDNIQRLKEDGLISGAKFRHTAKDGKSYNTEMYDLDEIISIGFRLRSEKALKFQKWAREIIRNELKEAHQKLRMQQAQLDYFWDEEDKKEIEDLNDRDI